MGVFEPRPNLFLESSLIPSEGNSMEGQQKELIEEVYNTVNDWDL
jgi:hypothetical protein